jgi:hypothetical protein
LSKPRTTAPPTRCKTANTFSAEKNRSAIIPTKKGETIAASAVVL